MQNIIDKINSKKIITRINEDCFELKTNAEFVEGIAVKVFLKRINGKIYLSDDKNTLRFINTKYDLKAPDVLQSINDVVKFYNFRIERGELLGEIKSVDEAEKRYNDMIVCSCTLANMFLFFEPLE